MTTPMERAAPSRSIPALAALGDQFSLAAAAAVADRPRRSPTPWPAVLVPGLAALVLVLGLSVRLTPSAAAMVVRAADTTAARTTGGFAMATHVAGGPTASAIDLSTDGVYDQSTGRIRTRVDLGRAFGGVGGAARVPGLDGAVDTIEDGSTIYLRSEVFERALPEHTAWVKVDTTKLDRSSPLSAASGLDGTVTDPAAFLDALRGIGDDTHVVERVDVDGVSTLHYQGTVDLGRAAEQLPPRERARLHDGFTRLGVDEATVQVPTDVWVDDAGLVRRVRTGVQVADAPGNDPSIRGAVVTVTVDYRDAGRPEPIGLPSPDEVTDITPLVNAVLGDARPGR